MAIVAVEALPLTDEVVALRSSPGVRAGLLLPRWRMWLSGLVARVQAAAYTIATASYEDQNAAIALTVLASAVPEGVYRVSYFLHQSAVAGVSAAFQVTLAWTSHGVALTETFTNLNGNTTGVFESVTRLLFCDGSTNISYSVTYASNPAGVAEFGAEFKAEAMG